MLEVASDITAAASARVLGFKERLGLELGKGKAALVGATAEIVQVAASSLGCFGGEPTRSVRWMGVDNLGAGRSVGSYRVVLEPNGGRRSGGVHRGRRL